MEIKNINETQNSLFKRKEITATIEQESNPSEVDVKKALAEKTKAPEENIKITKIGSNFGSKTFTITANIYESKEDLDKTETKSKKQRDAEKKAVEDAAKAEAEAKEAPVEEKVEEPKPVEQEPPTDTPEQTPKEPLTQENSDNKPEEKKE